MERRTNDDAVLPRTIEIEVNSLFVPIFEKGMRGILFVSLKPERIIDLLQLVEILPDLLEHGSYANWKGRRRVGWFPN